MFHNVKNHRLFSAVMMCGLIFFCGRLANADNGTLTSRTLTFSDSLTATLTASVKGDQFAGTKTTLYIQFTGDGLKTPQNSSGLSSVVFTLSKDGVAAQNLCVGLDTDVTPLACAFTPIADKRIQFILEEPTTSIYRVDITHKLGIGTGVTESWKLGVNSLPPLSPKLRGMASIQGGGATLSDLTPTGACGGSTICPSVCPVGQSCQTTPGPPICWWCKFEYVSLVVMNFPPPPPPCDFCPIPWNNPFGEEFERVMVSISPTGPQGTPLGPGKAREINVNLQGAQPVGPVTDVGGGQYAQMIEFRKGTTPTVKVTVGGQTVEKTVEVPGVQSEPPFYRNLSYFLGVLLVLALVALAYIASRGRGTARA